MLSVKNFLVNESIREREIKSNWFKMVVNLGIISRNEALQMAEERD